MTMLKFLNYGAMIGVGIGVSLIADNAAGDLGMWAAIVGPMLLVFGVKMTIEAGRLGAREDAARKAARERHPAGRGR
jgi:hypothetical protein